MLLKVDTEAVQKYLNPNKEKLKSKGIDSVKSRIENLTNLNSELTHDKLCDAIIQEFKDYYPGYKAFVNEINMQEIENNAQIKKIYNELTSWEWLYQKTPQFTNNLETRFDWGIIDIFVNVVDGIN
jgi:lipoate-protein ligase A